jgi:hypothetical protein
VRSHFSIVGLVLVTCGSISVDSFVYGQPAPVSQSVAIDRAIALLKETRRQLDDIRDYECRLVKRERVSGILLPESTLSMKVRNNPFSIYLQCESPEADRGTEVCYVAGRNGGKMRVRPPHMMGTLGFWTIDTNDPRALERNRHCITDAGLCALVNNTARNWEMERRLGKTVVQIVDDTLADRSCTRIETIHPDRSAGSFYGYRCVLWLDRATHLPVGAETYDWPRDDHSEPELLESYRFLNLRCNLGLSEATFAH